MVTYLAASNGRGASEFKKVNDDDPEPIDPAELAAMDPTGGLDDLFIFGSPETRRRFLKQGGGTSAAITIGPSLMGFGAVQTAESAPSAVAVTPPETTLKNKCQEPPLENRPPTTLPGAP